jgi:hypothetical protein
MNKPHLDLTSYCLVVSEFEVTEKCENHDVCPFEICPHIIDGKIVIEENFFCKGFAERYMS